jgi:acyl-CoA synthetase (AMP-forming)/AMP-acid ligase II
MNLLEMLRRTASNHPDHEAIVHRSSRLTYRDVFEKASRLSACLVQKGVHAGDRVVLLLENSPSYVISYFGVLGSGAVVVALNPDTTVHELKYLLSDSEATGIICHPSLLPLLAQGMGGSVVPQFILVDGNLSPESAKGLRNVERLADTLDTSSPPEPPSFACSQEDLAQIIYTSGTTGKPKGVMLTHRGLVANTKSIAAYLKLSERDRIMVILPFFYSYGNSLLLTHVFVGGTLVIAEQFVFLNTVVKQMLQEEVTGFSGVPSSYAMLLKQSGFSRTRFETLRYVTCAGGALSKASIGALQECLPKTEIYVMYGQTEASARLSYLEPSDVTRKMGSIGKGIPGVRLRVLRKDGTEVLPGEVGEITAEGDCLMKGYWNNPGATQKTLKANRLYTGDLATIDEEGFIFVVGRASEIIKSGSYRIHPIEIEEVLNSHPGVLESAAVGVDDTVLGEAIVAFIVARPDGSPPPSDLLRHARKFLPAFKVPRKIVFVDRLPKTSSGKIKRAALR